MTARLRWHRRDNEEMLDLMRELSAEEFGFLCGVIDLYCSRGGDVPNDDRFLAGTFSEDLRRWKRVKARLGARGLLEVRTDGRLYCGIAERVWHDGQRRYMDASRAGRASAAQRSKKGDLSTEIGDTYRLVIKEPADSYRRKSDAKSMHSSDLAPTRVQRPFEPYTDTKEEESGASRAGRTVSVGEAARSAMLPSKRKRRQLL